MIYDGEKLHIGVKELVTIARRGISATLQRDEDEPSLISETNSQSEPLELEFSAEENDYLLSAICQTERENEVVLTYRTDIASRVITASERAQQRGEGFVLCYMLAKKRGLRAVTLTLRRIDRQSGDIEEKTERISLPRLTEFFIKCTTVLSVFAKPEIDRVKERLPSLKAVKFPFSEVREGQAEFVRAVYRAICKGERLLAGAPTGTGKTVSVLYPALKAIGEGKCDKAFYLTPKTTTARSARECLELFASEGVKLRAVIISAKNKVCLSGGVCKTDRRRCECSASSDMPAAVSELYARGIVCAEGEVITEVARKHKVCPYELSLTYAELCDVVICDLNYLFDPAVYIRRFFDEGGRYAFLIDESHNLPDRIREMRSVEIGENDLDNIIDTPLLGELSALKETARLLKAELHSSLFPYVKEELQKSKDGEERGAQSMSFAPTNLYTFADEMLAALEKELLLALPAKDEQAHTRVEFIRDNLYLYKELRRALYDFDDGYRLFIFSDNGVIRIKLFLIDTSEPIRKCTDKGISTVFFSATLEPMSYYSRLLGLGNDGATVSIPSPFDIGSVSVSIMDKISTRYSERERTLGAVCRAIAATLSARRGNYMVFTPSFEYAQEIYNFFKAKYPKINALLQKRESSVQDKNEFIASFNSNRGSYLVGFCVLGGVFSEGIDLVGDSLIGAVVVGIGMPTLSYERERMSEYFEDRFDEGKQFAYVYPGMNKVFQAAGRVIRTDTDRGVIVLVDDRFADPIYKKSIPSLWAGMEYVDTPEALKDRLTEFWAGVDKESEQRKGK